MANVEGVLPAGHHLLLPLEWKDAPDRDGYWWLVGEGYNCPVWVYYGRMYRPGATFSLILKEYQGERWLWLGDIEAAARRKVEGG